MALVLIILSIPLLGHGLVPLSRTPLEISLSIQDVENDEGEFEFPPITQPIIDDSVVLEYRLTIIITSSVGTMTGIGFLVFGIIDLLSLVEQGYFSYESSRGIFFISAGLIISGISVAVLTPALDSLK
jgi:hypothetical protein